jgi:hypothetical protein
MSGENAQAKILVDEAIEQADQNSSMSSDSMALAILSRVLRNLSGNRSRADLESYIDYDLDNQVESNMVITRGC